ncbi:MAG: hypothetical protein QME51_06265 [Planctomycetota bacterium]|nr:hypothetical protein [Planctomycetota bacterium]
MLSINQVVKGLKKFYSAIELRFSNDWHYDILPATLWLGERQICGVPKGMVYRRTFFNEDGTIKHRGYEDIIRILTAHEPYKRGQITRCIERAEQGFVI